MSIQVCQNSFHYCLAIMSLYGVAAAVSSSVNGLGLHLRACSLYSTLNAIGPVLTLWKHMSQPVSG